MLFFTALIALVLSTAKAFPTAAGSCPAGMVAVGGAHLGQSAGVSNPTFASQGYTLLIGGVAVTADTELVDGETYEIAISSTMNDFRGALIRADGLGMFEAGTNSQVADNVCQDAPGVMHMDRSDKSMLSGMFTVMGEGTITLDVTVVEVNSAAAGSVYSYEQFQISSVAADAAPMDSPVMAPTMAAPTMAAPTMAAPTMTAPTGGEIAEPTTEDSAAAIPSFLCAFFAIMWSTLYF